MPDDESIDPEMQEMFDEVVGTPIYQSYGLLLAVTEKAAARMKVHGLDYADVDEMCGWPRSTTKQVMECTDDTTVLQVVQLLRALEIRTHVVFEDGETVQIIPPEEETAP